MKKKSILTRSMAWLLVFVMLFTGIPLPGAAKTLDIPPEALRVSDEFVAAYPNGLLEFATVNLTTQENSGEINLFLARRGGTKGAVTVGIKAIETTAKYGEDFLLIEEGFFGDSVVKKDLESPTIMEGSIQDNADVPITVENDQSALSTTRAAIMLSKDNDKTTTPTALNLEPRSPQVWSPQVWSPQAVVGKSVSGIAPTPTPTAEPVYSSSLHQMKDTVLNQKTTKTTVSGIDVFNVFGVKDEENIKRSEAINSVLPGAQYHVTFAEGEAYKHLKVRILDDKIKEDDETFNLGLFDIKGAVLGDALNASVIIKDNDQPDADARLYFAESTLSVKDEEGVARLKLVRSGNEQTYLAFDVATMADTAVSGKNYTTLVTNGVLLPGQTFKYIDIPIHYANIDKELSFDVNIKSNGSKAASARVAIQPVGENPGTTRLMSVSQPYITIKGKDYSNYDTSSGNVYTNASTGVAEAKLNGGGWYRAAWVGYGMDLRGIEKVGITLAVYNCESRYSDRHQTKIFVDGNDHKTWYHNQAQQEFTLPATSLYHANGRNLQVKTESWVWNNAHLVVDSIKLYKQKINLDIQPADTFNIPIYKNSKDIAGYLSDAAGNPIPVYPGSLSVTNNDTSRKKDFYRDDILNLSETLASEGEKYGVYLKGYQLYNPNTDTWSTFSGKTLTLTPDIIATYVYGDGKTYQSKLKIKPFFSRREAGSQISIGDYSSLRGAVKIDGAVKEPNSSYDGRERIISNVVTKPYWRMLRGFSNITYTTNWRVGDYLQVTSSPSEGYTGKGITDLAGTLLTDEAAGGLKVQLKAGTNSIIPKFERNDCGVTLTTGDNSDKLYVFHDRKDNSSSWEREQLNQGTTGLTNTRVDASGDTVVTNALNNKIKENYDRIRNNPSFQGRTLSNLAIGDVVTLYAETKDPAYTPYWTFDDGSPSTTTGEMLKYIKHYGESFTFEITAKDTIVTCGAMLKGAGDYVLRGKVVRLNNTLKSSRTYDRVNPNDAKSFIPVPNAALGVMSFNPAKQTYTDTQGSVYSLSTTTDSNGDFKMFVPNVSRDELFSVKYVNGGQAKAMTLGAINKLYYIETPYRDKDYTVTSILCQDSLSLAAAESNGALTIPADPTRANRRFRIETTTSSANHQISRVDLNSYNPRGDLIKTSITNRNVGDGSGYGVWTTDVNIAEILTEGGRLTVEVFDTAGRSKGEVETGYSITQDPPQMSVGVGAVGSSFGQSGLSNVPVVGNSIPTVPETTFNDQPDSAMEIAILSGKTLKAGILSNVERFNNDSNWEKLAYLTNYVSETFSTNAYNNSKETDNKKQTTSKTTFPISFDFGLYMKIAKSTDETGKTSYSLNYAFVSIALKAAVSTDIQTVIYGVPVYVSLSATGYGRGIVGLMGDSDDFELDSIQNNDFIFLLGKYGKDAIANPLTDPDQTNQDLLRAIYLQSGLTRDKMPRANDSYNNYKGSNVAESILLNMVWTEKKKNTVDGLNKLIIKNPTFYWENEALFEAKSDTFSADLLARIDTYKEKVQIQRINLDSNSTTTFVPSVALTNVPDLSPHWLQRLNLMLLIESLDEYLIRPKFTLSTGDSNGIMGLNLDQGRGIETVGLVTLQPRFALGAGIGKRGILSVGISGHINFILNYQPWSDGRGTVTFALNADLDLLVIPLTIRLVGYTVEMFKSPGYIMNAFDYEGTGASGIFFSADQAAFNQGLKSSGQAFVRSQVKRVRGPNELTKSSGISLMSTTPGAFQQKLNGEYYMQTTKHPQPQIFSLPGSKKILFYLNDNRTRAEYDRNSVYYTIYDGNAWSTPVELDPDGTLDGDLTAVKLADGRIVAAWTDSGKVFGSTRPEMADILSAQGVSACIFSADGTQGEVTRVAGNSAYAYSNPVITYDDTSDTVMLVYKMTDYHTQDVDFNYDDIQGTYSNFFANSYSTLAYHLYNGTAKAWQTVYDPNNPADRVYIDYTTQSGISLNGSRFITAGVTGVENPNIDEAAAGAYNGKTYLVYTMDLDNNKATDQDKELFTLIYDYSSKSFMGPIRLTDNLVDEANPRVVISSSVQSILFGSGGGIYEIPLASLTEENFNAVNGGSHYIYTQAVPNGDSDILQTTNVLGYENQDAAQSFTATAADNGQVYLLWNQLETSKNELGQTQAARNLYLLAFDPKYKEVTIIDPVTSESHTVYEGNWGKPGKITVEKNVHLNEAALMATPDNQFTLAFRQYEFETVGSGADSYQKESDTSTLFVSVFKTYTTVSIDEATLSRYPDYPQKNELITVNYSADNYGSNASVAVQFNYYLVSDADLNGLDQATGYTWSKTDQIGSLDPALSGKFLSGTSYTELEGKTIEGHLRSGGSINDSVHFAMPEYGKSVSLYIVAREIIEGGTTIQTPSIIRVPIGINPVIEGRDILSEATANKDKVYLKGKILNTGNATAQNLKAHVLSQGTYDLGAMVLDSTNDQTNLSEQVNRVVGTISIPALAPDEVYEFGLELIDPGENSSVTTRSAIADLFTSDGKATFNIYAEYDEVNPSDNSPVQVQALEPSTSISLIQSSTAEIQAPYNPSLSNISISSAEGIISDRISVNPGETKALDYKLEPYGTSSLYSLLYESANPAVAAIDPSTGALTGKQAGTTDVHVKVIKSSLDSVLVGLDNSLTLHDGTALAVNNEGRITNLSGQNAAGNEVIMTKTLSVTVPRGYERSSSSQEQKIQGEVVNAQTGQSVAGIEVKVVAKGDGTKTVSFTQADALQFKKADGGTSTITNMSLISYSASSDDKSEGKPQPTLGVGTDGSVKIEGLSNGSQASYDIKLDLGNGQQIIIGKLNVTMSAAGEASLTTSLIDPYGIITDATTGDVIKDAHVVLRYADSERNRKTGRVPHAQVDLPILAGFAPNDNKNPQSSDVSGSYAYMVFPTTDYYLEASKPGYNIYISPTITVEQEIVKWDFRMNPLTPAKTGIERLAGADRIATALEIAKATYPGGVQNVILAAGDNYPDALAGGVLAYRLQAPILLVGKSPEEQDKVLSYLKENLGLTGGVYILGGTGAVSQEMEEKVRTAGYAQIKRLGGSDRYETALRIADELGLQPNTPVFIVSGEDYPDALAISSIAAINQFPILLAEKDVLPEGVRTKLSAMDPGKAFLIGQEGALSKTVEDAISKATSIEPYNLIRLGGLDRYETSNAIAKYFELKGGYATVGTGENFPDALAGSLYAAKFNSHILLVDKAISSSTQEYLRGNKISGITIFGGEGAVSNDLAAEFEQVLGK